MVNEHVLDQLVGTAQTIHADPEMWSNALCAAYEANPSDFGAFVEALRLAGVDGGDVAVVEQVLRDQGELSAVAELCGGGADELRYAVIASGQRLAEPAPSVEAPVEPPQEAEAEYDRDEAFPWVIELTGSVIGNWDGTDESWPDFQQEVIALVEQQSGGRTDLVAAATDLFVEIDSGGDRIATLQVYGITIAMPEEPGEAEVTYDRDETFPWIAQLTDSIVGQWDGTDQTWPAFQEQVAELVDQQSGGRADLAAATTGFFAEIDAGADRVATLQAYGVSAAAPPAAVEAADTVAQDVIAAVNADDAMPDIEDYTPEEIEQAIELAMKELESRA